MSSTSLDGISTHRESNTMSGVTRKVLPFTMLLLTEGEAKKVALRGNSKSSQINIFAPVA